MTGDGAARDNFAHRVSNIKTAAVNARLTGNFRSDG